MLALDHIAIVTDDIDKTIRIYEEILGVKSNAPVNVPDQGVISAVVPLDNVKIEIMQPTDSQGGIQKYLTKKGPGIHHIALRVEDREASLAELDQKGVKLIIGSANGKPSAFIHPKSMGGVLIELK